MSADAEQPDGVDRDPRRLEAFSDAVMAVIITILALELRPPEHPTLTSLRTEVPSLLVYVLSFTLIAIYWNNHHHLLRATTRINGAVMWANMVLLFWLSLIPVVTEWVREDFHEPLPAASFGVIALGAALSYAVLVRTIIRANGRESFVGRAIASDRKGNASLAMYAAGIGLAYVDVWFAYVLYAAVAVMWLVPDRRFATPAPDDASPPPTGG